MISKTSFFSKGIYKSTVKRYSWGMVLYFIVLFLSTGLTVFLNANRDFSHLPVDFFGDYPIILHGSYMVLPILLAIVVPSVVALMIFRFIHSKKQAVFIHSLPATRGANFVSSMAAAFTLMFVPVVANGIILILISLCGYGSYFSVADCMWWMGYNLFGLFLMFSCAVFAANLTGNSFAMIVINVIIHTFAFITVASFSIMAEAFIYGYTTENIIYDMVANNNFAYVVFGFADRYFREKISLGNVLTYSVIALGFYVVSFFLYKKRRLETSGDVAGYKCLNVILKYIVSFMATMLGFAMFSEYLGENYAVFAIIMAIISLIAYSASEMVLKKTFNIIYSWKGYVGFAIVFIAITALFSQTSFFGYETRLPEITDIKEASIYNYYYGDTEPFTDDEKIINMVWNVHKSIIKDSNIPKTISRGYNSKYDTNVHIKYKLKNGMSLERTYPINSKHCAAIMEEFYKDTDYKKKCEKIFIDDLQIKKVYMNYEEEIPDYKGLIEAIREDVLSLSYEELHSDVYDGYETLYPVTIQYIPRKNDNKITQSSLSQVYINITERYKNTVEWFEENGY